MTDLERYIKAMHGVQSGIAMELEAGLSEDTSPKHLRVGVNSALVDSAALAELLIGKGLISREEYERALAEGAERERYTYEQRLTRVLGIKVSLE